MIPYHLYAAFMHTIQPGDQVGSKFCILFGISDAILQAETDNRKAITRILQHYVSAPQSGATRSDDIAR